MVCITACLIRILESLIYNVKSCAYNSWHICFILTVCCADALLRVRRTEPHCWGWGRGPWTGTPLMLHIGVRRPRTFFMRSFSQIQSRESVFFVTYAATSIQSHTEIAKMFYRLCLISCNKWSTMPCQIPQNKHNPTMQSKILKHEPYVFLLKLLLPDFKPSLIKSEIM